MYRFLKGFLISVLAFVIIYFLFVYMPASFRGHLVPNPNFISFGEFTIKWYGFLIACGVLIAYFLSDKEMVKNSVKPSTAEAVPIYVILLGLIGARLGFVLQNIPYFSQNFLEIFIIWDGGLSIHGAILGGIVGIWIGALIYRESFIKIANSIAPTIFVAGAIGRLGNFFNQEIIGQPTQVPWKMYIAPQNRPVGYENFNFFHPVFLYESTFFIIFYLIYLYLSKRKGSWFGFAYTLIFYSLIRIIIEFWRIDYKPIFGPFDLAQLVSFGIILVGLVVGFVTLTKRKI